MHLRGRRWGLTGIRDRALQLTGIRDMDKNEQGYRDGRFNREEGSSLKSTGISIKISTDDIKLVS